MALVRLDDFKQLLLSGQPVIDVRAPVEFARGAVPGSKNLPILDDVNREQIGICYKQFGPDAAERLGYDLVSGEIREAVIANWISHLRAYPQASLYCFRGGQRSKIASQWLASAGFDVPRVEGGFKQIRQFLIQQFTTLPPIVILSGQTGSGKTAFLQELERSIDLEGLANHRGSAFGSYLTPQPTQIDFENALAVQLLRVELGDNVLLEDESRLIGKINLPVPLQQKMAQAPIILLEESVSARTNRIFDEYIVSQWQEYQRCLGLYGYVAFEQYLLKAIDAIRKRLGDVAHHELRHLMTSALELQRDNNDLELHKIWITRLLVDYYDPMYAYQLSKKSDRIRSTGSWDELLSWYRTGQHLLT